MRGAFSDMYRLYSGKRRAVAASVSELAGAKQDLNVSNVASGSPRVPFSNSRGGGGDFSAIKDVIR